MVVIVEKVHGTIPERAMYGKEAQYIDTKKINEVAKSMNSKFLEVA